MTDEVALEGELVSDEVSSRESLSPEDQEKVRDYTVDLPCDKRNAIFDLVQQGKGYVANSIASIIDFGKVLLKLKEELAPGSFVKCVQREYEISDQTARNFMNVAKKFGDKPKYILGLKPGVVYQLAAPSTPPEVVDKVCVKYLSGEGVAYEDLVKMIKNAKKSDGSVLLKKSGEKVSIFDNPDQVTKEELGDLEEKIKKGIMTLFSNAEKVEDDLQLYWRKVRDDEIFFSNALKFFKLENFSNEAQRVIKTLAQPDQFLRLFGFKSD